VVLDDLVPTDHECRVIDAFVDGLAMAELGFERAEAAETGRPGYDPRDLLKLYLYGYLHQLRSSRRLEAECRRNVELMWLLGRLYRFSGIELTDNLVFTAFHYSASDIGGMRSRWQINRSEAKEALTDRLTE
jgi:transposase